MSARTAVLMPLPGIGDLVWHLPFIHAIADTSPERRVTLIVKPRTGAASLLGGDRAIGGVIEVDRNPEGARAGRHDGALGFLRMSGLLRQGGLRRIFILHRSWRYGWAARLAGIPERYSYAGCSGARQDLHPGLDRELRVLHPYRKAARFLELLDIPVSEAEPVLPLVEEALTEVRARYGHLPRPVTALGMGSSEPNKRWPAARFGALAARLLEAGWGTVLLIGGPADAAEGEAARAAAGAAAKRLVPIFELSLDRSAALLSLADGYIGNDTGMLNVAAAVGTRAVGLFGATEPLSHSRHIEAVTPEGGISWTDGMAGIPVGAALAALGPPGG